MYTELILVVMLMISGFLPIKKNFVIKTIVGVMTTFAMFVVPATFLFE